MASSYSSQWAKITLRESNRERLAVGSSNATWGANVSIETYEPPVPDHHSGGLSNLLRMRNMKPYDPNYSERKPGEPSAQPAEYSSSEKAVGVLAEMFGPMLNSVHF